MGYISKYDTKFLTQMNRKYNKKFEFWDDYSCWLYYDIFAMSDEQYYDQLEEDIKEYVEFQSGKERDAKEKMNSRWDDDRKEQSNKNLY